MFLEVRDLLTPDEVRHLRGLFEQLKFVDGRSTNVHSKVKNNLQLDYEDPGYKESSALMHAAFMRNEEVQAFAFPKVIAPPLLTRYAPGMNYGAHSDAPFMKVGERLLRSDLSSTIFLADPETYEGGELSVQVGGRRLLFKLPAGGAVVYPSTTLHEVVPVTSGERLVAITFMESRVPDQFKRELLWQLNEVVALEGFNMSWDSRTRLNYVAGALARMWGESSS
jgi:PKHD-type hydroxylase